MKIAPLLSQVVDDVGVVHDLVAHVDRRAELAAAPARRSRSRGRRRRRSRAARRGRLLRHGRRVKHGTPISCTSNVTRPAGERMVEVEQQRVAADLADDAGEARLAVRAWESGRRRRPGSRHRRRRARPSSARLTPLQQLPGCARRTPRRARARTSCALPSARPSRRASIAGASSPVPSDSVAGCVAKVSTNGSAVGAASRR